MDTVRNDQSLDSWTLKRVILPWAPDWLVQRLVWLARAGFILALCAVVYLSLKPTDPFALTNAWIPWDKARHYLAYLSLSALALIAFANIPTLWIGICLFSIGAGIEFLQPVFDRSLSVFDLAANLAGILTALGLVFLVALRVRIQQNP